MVTLAYDLKHQLDLREVVCTFWGDPKRRHSRYDQHFSQWRDDGSRPSFTVYATHFHDYGGGGETGDVFAFVQRQLNTDFAGALAWMQQYRGVSAPAVPTSVLPTRPTAAHEPPCSDWQSAAAAALQTAQAYLWSNAPDARRVRDYLRQVRGLSNETIRAAGLGYNPRWTKTSFKSPESPKAAALPPGIIIPWWNEGTLWALRVRCRVGNLAAALGVAADRDKLGDELPKYLSLAGSKQAGALYNGDQLQPDRAALLVEGEFDALLAQQMLSGHLTAVTLGSASSQLSARRLAQLQTARRVYLLLDNDAAGKSAQTKLLKVLGETAHILRLPCGKDLTEFVVEQGGTVETLLAPLLSPAWWPGGVPDSVRSALLTYFRDSTAPVIEMFNRAVHTGLLDPNAFTVSDLLRANVETGFSIQESSVRRVLFDLTGQFFAKVETPPQQSVSTIAKNAGRRAVTYRMLGLAEVQQAIIAWAGPRLYMEAHPVLGEGVEESGIVAQPTAAMFEALRFAPDEARELAKQWDALIAPVYALQGEIGLKARKAAERELRRLLLSLRDTHSTPLPEGWPLSTAKAYRVALLRATFQPDERRSRKAISRLLGVGNSRIDPLVKAAGLQRAAAGGEFELLHIQSPQQLDRQIREAAQQFKGYPLAIETHTAAGRVMSCAYTGAASHPFISQQLQAGSAIYVRYQVANRYVAVFDQPLEADPPAEVTTPQSAPVPPPEPASLPETPLAQARSRRKRHIGPGYDPLWVAGQLRLALLVLGRVVYRHAPQPVLIDTETGEVLGCPAPYELVSLCLEGGQ